MKQNTHQLICILQFLEARLSLNPGLVAILKLTAHYVLRTYCLQVQQGKVSARTTMRSLENHLVKKNASLKAENQGLTISCLLSWFVLISDWRCLFSCYLLTVSLLTYDSFKWNIFWNITLTKLEGEVNASDNHYGGHCHGQPHQ